MSTGDDELATINALWSTLTLAEQRDLRWMLELGIIREAFLRRRAYTANRRWLHVKDAVVIGGLEPRIIG